MVRWVNDTNNVDLHLGELDSVVSGEVPRIPRGLVEYFIQAKSRKRIFFRTAEKFLNRRLSISLYDTSFHDTMHYYSIFFILFSVTKAQFPPVNKSLICPASTLDNANASGTGTFDASLLASLGKSDNGNRNLSWAMTVNEGSQTDFNNVSFPTVDTSIWIGQPPSINLYDGSNAFSACAISFGDLPINTIERGQDDDGSCYQTFSKPCVAALTNQLANFAQWQTSGYTGGPYSNLTPPILGYVCGNIQAAVGVYSDNGPVGNLFPAECQPYFDDGRYGGPVTYSYGK